MILGISAQDSIFCPKCGHASGSELHFCTRCGTDLGLVGDALTGAVVRAPTEGEARTVEKAARNRVIRGVALLLLSVGPAKLMFFIGSVFAYLVATGGSWGIGIAQALLFVLSLVAFFLLAGYGVRDILTARRMKKACDDLTPQAARAKELHAPPTAITVDGLDARAFDAAPPSVTEHTTRRLESDPHPVETRDEHG